VPVFHHYVNPRGLCLIGDCRELLADDYQLLIGPLRTRQERGIVERVISCQ